MSHSGKERQMIQKLSWGNIELSRLSPVDTMFTTTGRRIYVLGDIDGRFRPRSNPYDLHTFGMPHPKDPLGEKLQGVWAQPVKGVSAYACSVEYNGETWALQDAVEFEQSFASVTFTYRREGLEAVRQDFAAQDQPLLFSQLTLRNDSAVSLDLRVIFTVVFDLEDAWFTRLAKQRNNGENVTIEQGCLVARAKALPERWAAAAGAALGPDGSQLEDVRLLENSSGEFRCRLHLQPGQSSDLLFGMVVESQGGAPAALEILTHGLANSRQILAEKHALYDQLLNRGPRFDSPDPLLNTAFDVARANLQMLEAEAPSLGRYFYAGLETFPFWFSNDGAYSISGLLASGFNEAALNHIHIGLKYLGDGRVPHQISPSGRVAFQGNAQETPQWVMCIWDAFRWTGSRAFLAEHYPGAVKGIFDYVLGELDPDGDGYPSSPGMVEAEGMGPEKLDSAAYTWAALHTVAEMAGVLDDPETAAKAREQADRIAARFDDDWWDEPSGTYSMSLSDPDNRRYHVPHWAVIVPLEVGLAEAGHAAKTFATMRKEYINQWGLQHTVGSDERVWTLPTATLSRAAYRYGENELAFEMLHHLAETLEAGSIGLFHELIPEGASILQLWSGAIFIRGIIEDLLGIQVNAAESRVEITPHLPADWKGCTLQALTFGEHQITVQFEQGAVAVTHHRGPAPLVVQCGSQEATIAPGAFKRF